MKKLLLTSLLISSSQAAVLYSWNAASGLLPDAITPAAGGVVALRDTSTADPTISNGALTISTSAATQSQVMFYTINFGLLADSPTLFENGFIISATVRVDSGSQFDRRRAPASISANIGGSIKSPQLGTNFVSLMTDFEFPFPNATTTNTGAFNDFRIEYDGQTKGSAVRMYKNDTLILSSNTGDQTGTDRDDIHFTFGESSGIAGGVTQWQSFKIETIPEPSSALLILSGIAPLLRRRR